MVLIGVDGTRPRIRVRGDVVLSEWATFRGPALSALFALSAPSSLRAFDKPRAGSAHGRLRQTLGECGAVDLRTHEHDGSNVLTFASSGDCDSVESQFEREAVEPGITNATGAVRA